MHLLKHRLALLLKHRLVLLLKPFLKLFLPVLPNLNNYYNDYAMINAHGNREQYYYYDHCKPYPVCVGPLAGLGPPDIPGKSCLWEKETLASALASYTPTPLSRSASSTLTFHVPLVLRDGTSGLTSSGTVTVSVCPCLRGGAQAGDKDKDKQSEGEWDWEREAVCLPQQSSLPPPASAPPPCWLSWPVSPRYWKRDSLSPLEEDDVRENIITYDDEGGGEADTAAFDIAALQSAPHSSRSPAVSASPPPSSSYVMMFSRTSSSSSGDRESRFCRRRDSDRPLTAAEGRWGE
ncbi:hypothetical protein F7725_011825 [Dissostichus mawsoni]|uniref:Uncharacterized protein n=1 Tax=Dissostichus mawsoni TaxID=36200 RepID=A0A7J5Z9Y1_DISMA|nr:hypothetical protein F7725_011825 [Dissostichus mawsoni]